MYLHGNAFHANKSGGISIKQAAPVGIYDNSITCNAGTGILIIPSAKVPWYILQTTSENSPLYSNNLQVSIYTQHGRQCCNVGSMSLWLNCLDFLINQVNHSKSGFQPQLISHDVSTDTKALNQSLTDIIRDNLKNSCLSL